MIIIIPVNGLLNRIRSILSAKLIANALGEKLSVLWIPELCCNCHYEHIFGNNHVDTYVLMKFLHLQKDTV